MDIYPDWLLGVGADGDGTTIVDVSDLDATPIVTEADVAPQEFSVDIDDAATADISDDDREVVIPEGVEIDGST